MEDSSRASPRAESTSGDEPASTPARSTRPLRPRRVRPSRARGLRTSTGCLTCRRRRVKCDERRPQCLQCSKSDRNCRFPSNGRIDEGEAQHGVEPLAAAASTSAPVAHQPPARSTTDSEARQDKDASVAGSPATSLSAAVANSMAASDLGDIASGLDRGIPGVEHALTPGDLRPRGPSFRSVETPIMNSQPVHSVSFDLDPSTYDFAESIAVDAAGASAFTPQVLSQADLFNITPFDWYDLLAQDAISNIQRQNNLGGEFQWSFDERTLSRKQSPVPEALEDQHSDTHSQNNLPSERHQPTSATHPWNTADNIELTVQDMEFFDHYIRVIGPILDLFDQERHFTNVVPHLAIRNIGLLKSLLAVAARHKSLSCTDQSSETSPSPATNTSSPKGLGSAHLATQYYYETLQYLSQTLLYPQYAYSLEILATAIMITQYEMYDAGGTASNNGDWERHLRGAFWIQRSQDNDGEMVDGLRRAVWWAWVRQDIWAAFRAGRPTLTIWRPKKRLDELTADELAWRIVYIAAKCVGYAATTSHHTPEQSLAQRVEQGDRLLKMLQEWYDLLPASYRPLNSGFSGSEPAISHATPTTPSTGPTDQTSPASGQPWLGPSTQFTPIWIHPQNYAGAVQMYHFAKALVVVNQPTEGGLNSYRRRQRTLNESLHTICGIAKTCREDDYAMAFVNVQAVFAAGQYVQMKEEQAEVVQLLDSLLDVSRFPSKSLIEELRAVWQDGTG